MSFGKGIFDFFMKIINKNTRQNKIKCLNLSLSLSLWRLCECKNTIDAARERNTNAALVIARTISHHLRLRISIGNFLISSSYFLFTLNLNLRSPDVVILSVGYGSNKFLFWTPCHAIIFFFFLLFLVQATPSIVFGFRSLRFIQMQKVRSVENTETTAFLWSLYFSFLVYLIWNYLDTFVYI